MEDHLKLCTQSKRKCFSTKFISIFVSSLFLVIILLQIQYSSPFEFSLSARSQRWGFLSQENYSGVIETMTEELKTSVTFLPLVDFRFRETATTGHTCGLWALWMTHSRKMRQNTCISLPKHPKDAFFALKEGTLGMAQRIHMLWHGEEVFQNLLFYWKA